MRKNLNAMTGQDEHATGAELNARAGQALDANDQALFKAIEAQDERAVKSALDRGADANRPHAVMGSPLIMATLQSQEAIVRALLDAGADPNQPDPVTGNAPLCFSTFQAVGVELARALLDAGADPDAPGSNGRSARHFAEVHGRTDIQRLLRPNADGKITRGIPASAEPPERVAPWDAARMEAAGARLASGRSAEMSKAIGEISLAAFSDAISEPGYKAFAIKVSEGLSRGGIDRAQLSEALLLHAPEAILARAFNAEQAQAAFEDCSDFGSAFDRASAFGRIEQLRFWAAACGPNWNPDGMSPPLSWTIYGKSLAGALELLALGANPNASAPDSTGASGKFDVNRDAPLHLAIAEGQREIALALLGAGASATSTDRESLAGLRALIDERERAEVVSLLAALLGAQDAAEAARGAGALGALHACGWTRDSDFEGLSARADQASARFGPGFAESCRSALETIERLEVEFEARLEKRSELKSFQGSVLDRAAATGEHRALDFFAACAGADWNPEGGDGPLDWAANVGDARAVELLAARGAVLGGNPDEPDSKSMPPLARAALGPWREACAKILELGADPMGLTESEAGQVRELLGVDGLSRAEARARADIESDSPERGFFGLRQMWNLAKVGWVSDWPAALSSLDRMGFPAHLDAAPSGMTLAGESLLREGGYLESDASGSPLGGRSNFFAKIAASGDVPATLFLARTLGADFRSPGDNGSALANAAAHGRADSVLGLCELGAKTETHPKPLEISASRSDADTFLALASFGADPLALSPAARAAIAPALASKIRQGTLLALMDRLEADQDGFDSFLAPCALPASTVAAWIRSGQKERFWRARDQVDWTRHVGSLVDAATADGETGLGAYARFRRAVAADDVQAASEIVSGSPALLASLARRGLADETILSALGAGRSSLMNAMSQAGWPMASTMRARAAEVLGQAAATQDTSMFEHLLPLIPVDGSLGPADQALIARSAWKLGGAALLARFDAQIQGIAPSAIEDCRDLFSGSEGERAFSQMVLFGAQREGGRSRALEKRDERTQRRKAYFGLAASHWSSFSEAQKLDMAVAISSWNETGFWERAEKIMSSPEAHALAGSDGPEAFYAFCFGSRQAARAVFAVAAPECARPLAIAAQVAAASRDDAEMAQVFTVDAGVPASESAILTAARLGHRRALTTLLARAEGSALQGLLSRALISPTPGAFDHAQSPGYEIPDWACRELADAGASFDPKDVQGSGVARWTALVLLALQGKISIDRERAFSTLVLRGALPERSWMNKTSILSREPSLMELAGEPDRNDALLALAAVSADGMALRHCGPLARATVSVVRAAVAQNADAAHCAHPALISALGIKHDQALAVLVKAEEDMKTINPLRLFARKAADKAQARALESARAEMETQLRAKQIDFSFLERSMAEVRLVGESRSQAESALATARAIKAGVERSGDGKATNMLDLADLRRVVEKNLPELLGRYGATDPSARDSYDSGTRSTPNKMLKAGFEDAETTMRRVAERLDEGARVGLAGEAAVLASKAKANRVLSERRTEDFESAGRDAAAEGTEPDGSTLRSFSTAGDSSAASTELEFPPRDSLARRLKI